MPQIRMKSGRPALAALALAVLTAVTLAACGGSSKSPTATTNAAATTAAGDASATATSTTAGTTTTKAGTPAPVQARRDALRECLHKQGITLPAPKPGQTGGLFGPGGQLPPGVTRKQLNAALSRCASQTRRRFRAGALHLQPAAKKAFTEFAACMRKNGVDLPPPDTSGKGPIFNTKALNTASSKFKAASATCRQLLVSAFRARPGIHPPGSGEAAPGAPQPTG